MFKKINLLICLMIIFVVFSGLSNKVYANETFYYKGSTYTGSYSDGLNGSNTTASSVVVISASAAFGYPMGKERVRLFTRCDTINGIYGSYICNPVETSIRFSASHSNGVDNGTSGFITATYLRPSEAIDLTDFTWIFNSYRVELASRTISAIANEVRSNSIDHTSGSYDSAKRVIFKRFSKSLLDVPNTVSYNTIDSHFNNSRKGVSATFSFHYQVPNGGYVTVKGDAEYDLRIAHDSPYTPPLLLLVKTGEARLTHSIGM